MARQALNAGMHRFAALCTVVCFVALHLFPGVLAGQRVDDDPFVDCEARVNAQPASWASLCFLHTARAHQLWAEGQRRVAVHLAHQPADPYLHFTLGFLTMQSGSIPKAGDHFHAAAAAFAARGESEGEVLAWLNVGECLLRQARLDEAGQAFRRADVAARTTTDPRLRVRVGVRQAQFMRLQGRDLERAHSLLLQMQEELPEEAGYQTWKSLLYERAVVLHRLGRYQEARRTNERWAALARAAGQGYDEATALSNRAINVADAPPRSTTRDAAIRLAHGAREAAERTGNRSAAITAHRLLGKLLAGDEGRPHLDTCLRLTTAAGEPPQQAACLFALAGNAVTTDPAHARATLNQALDLAAAAEDPWTVIYGWGERFRVNWASLSRQEATADSLTVLGLIEALRNVQDSAIGRAGFFSGWAEVYYALAGHLLAAPGGPTQEELATAFNVAERLRARVLLDNLTADREQPAAADDGRADERTPILEAIVHIQQRLQNPRLGEAERITLLAELDVQETELAALEALFGFAAPTALPAAGFVTLAQAEAKLAPEEALLAFLVAPDQDIYGKFAGGSWLLAITHAGTRSYRLPGRLELEIKTEMFLGLVARRDDTVLAYGAATLYDDLLAAALAELPPTVETLILVPDGVLHLLPFGLLRPHPQSAPLNERFHLSAVPSAILWLRWRQQPSMVPPAALVLADPAFLGDVAGNDEAGDRWSESQDRQWTLATGAQLSRLPHAVTEGRALLRRLGGPPSRLLVGEEASEGFLKAATFDDIGVLHIAAHALVDDQRPHRSAVLLAAGGPLEDGLLQPREIAGLDLDGKLVVLSACESGSGQMLLGEGVQSLARAFFQAGARAVVASQWRLRDDEAAAFFDRFYQALAVGDRVAGAVTAAQRARRQDGAPAAAWSGVMVLGDGGMVPLPGGITRPQWRPLLVLVATAIVAAALLAVARGEPRSGRAY